LTHLAASDMSRNSLHTSGSTLPQPPPHIVLDGVKLAAVTEAQCVMYMFDHLDQGLGGWVITPNLDHMRRARLDSDYRTLLTEADLVVADGMPLIWASRIQRTALPQRVAGSALVWSIAQTAARRGRSIFLLGGDPGTAEKSAQTLKDRYNGLLICGSCCPPMGFENDPQMVAELRQKLAAAKPDVVYVALGSPKQEELIRQIRDDLPQAWWLGVGISFSFLSGHVKRAPQWVQRIGLEWVHRLGQEPRRLARRYLIEGFPYAARLLFGAVRRRWSYQHAGR
jgi:N-acetylglucosaminyldiphosphoundecaprenol N-acetyl-beta-D-mannosaminyltransferase